jgi:hypothetical protein
MNLQHKPFGLTHPTWARPECFDFDTAEAAEASILKVYGEGSGHLVVGVIA